MSKKLIYLIAGGPGGEHDVSLSTAKSMEKYLDKTKYEIKKIIINKDSSWDFEGKKYTAEEVVKKLDRNSTVLIGLHGTFGEDGQLQKLLDQAGIAFTGSGFIASQNAFDKEQAQRIYEKAGMPVPFWQILNTASEKIDLKLPFVVKPAREGSSVGVSLCKSEKDIDGAIAKAFKHDSKVMIQKMINGPEVSCGVIENPNPTVLTPTQIVPKTEFYDYEAKYSAGQSEHLLPPNLESSVIKQIQDLALKAHKVLGCRGYSRTDFLVEDGDVFLLETNTLPGMTSTSLLPEQAKHDGIEFSDLLDLLISNATHD